MDCEQSAFSSAQQRHHRYMVFGKKQRYIEVFQCSGEDMHLVLTGGLALPSTPQTPKALLSPGMLPWDPLNPLGAAAAAAAAAAAGAPTPSLNAQAQQQLGLLTAQVQAQAQAQAQASPRCAIYKTRGKLQIKQRVSGLEVKLIRLDEV